MIIIIPFYVQEGGNGDEECRCDDPNLTPLQDELESLV